MAFEQCRQKVIYLEPALIFIKQIKVINDDGNDGTAYMV